MDADDSLISGSSGETPTPEPHRAQRQLDRFLSSNQPPLAAPAHSGGPTPIQTNWNELATEIHAVNRKWWFRPDGTPIPRNRGELLMLVVTEIAEAFEGERKDLMDDKLPHRRMAEVEVVDAIVRLLDYAGAYGYDLDGAFREKMAFNASREDHKREAEKIATGKQF